MTRTALTAFALLSAQAAVAQTTVPYLSAGWKDFGTTNITGLAGNFLPGWTSLTATPDLGDDVIEGVLAVEERQDSLHGGLGHDDLG